MADPNKVPSPQSLLRTGDYPEFSSDLGGSYPQFGPELDSYEHQQERLRNYVAALMHRGSLAPQSSPAEQNHLKGITDTANYAGFGSTPPYNIMDRGHPEGSTPFEGRDYSTGDYAPPFSLWDPANKSFGPSDDPIFGPAHRSPEYHRSADPTHTVEDLQRSKAFKDVQRQGLIGPRNLTPEQQANRAALIAGVPLTAAAFANPAIGMLGGALASKASGDGPADIAKDAAIGALPYGVGKLAKRFGKVAVGTVGGLYGSLYPDPVSADKSIVSAKPSGTRPAFTDEDTQRMRQLESEISNLQKQQQSKILEVGPKKGANVIEGFRSQIDSKQNEINRMRSDMLEKQSSYDKATLPIAVRNPDAMFKSRAGALGGSLASGVLAGAFSNPKSKWPWLLSAGLGGLEGAVGVSAPSLMDLGQPEGTPAREQAEKNLAYISHPTEPGSWDFAKNVIAPESVYGAGLGLIGHGIGHNIGTVGRSIGKGVQAFRPVPEPSPIPPSVPPSMLKSPAPTAGGKVWPSDPGQINMYKDASGKWREQGTGHFIPKRLLGDQEQVVKALLNKPK